MRIEAPKLGKVPSHAKRAGKEANNRLGLECDKTIPKLDKTSVVSPAWLKGDGVVVSDTQSNLVFFTGFPRLV